MSSGKQPSSSRSRRSNSEPTHEVNLVCNDGACALWATSQILGVTKSFGRYGNNRSVAPYIPQILNYMDKNPPANINKVRGLLINTRNNPGSFRNRQYNTVTDPRFIYPNWSSLPRKTNISIHPVAKVPHVIRTNRRPARGNTYNLPEHSGKNLFIHSGNHWNVLRAINVLKKEFHRKFNASKNFKERLKIGIEYERLYNNDKLRKEALRSASDGERFEYALTL